MLQGQFVSVRQQLEEDAEVVEDPPVPVVIKGIQMVPSDNQDYDDYDTTSNGKKPAFSFDNDTTMNLDGPGYALSLLLIGEIVILAMAFFAGGLNFGGRSFPSLAPITFPGESWLRRLMADLGHGDEAPVQTQSSWSTASSAQPWSDLGLGGRQEPGTWNWT